MNTSPRSFSRTPTGSPTETTARISRRFTEIMVDEYQDVSRVQDVDCRCLG
ncbi:MAG: hypothetical protein V8S87_05505 [Oscillospiraceae bacterium]